MSRIGTVHSSRSIAQVGTQLPAVDEILVNAVAALEEKVAALEEKVNKLTKQVGI
jgi:hypothetical protein